MMDRLVKSAIEPKMITGDNIFIAIETGIRAGILKPNDQVILLEGRKQPQHTVDGMPRTFKGVLLTRHGGNTTQESIELIENENYEFEPYPIAVDNDFLNLEPTPKILDTMKIFARISPENKAHIVMKFKEAITTEYDSRPFLQRTFGPLKSKVGMCGDGANDLIAIREADVGIGINNSDAAYGATFSIMKMLDVDEIVRDSKAATANLMEIIRYFEFITWVKIPATLLMTMDTIYFHGNHFLYFNFGSTIVFSIFMAMSSPSKNPTRLIPNGNSLSLINHLRFWGSVVITTGGFVAVMFYFRGT